MLSNKDMPACTGGRTWLFVDLKEPVLISHRVVPGHGTFLLKAKDLIEIGICASYKYTGLVACKKAGIPYGRFVKDGFVFHDLRHTFNTNMRMAGVAESVIMEITGHSTREMFDRYNTVDDEDKRQAIDQLQRYLESVDQNVDHTPSGKKKGLAPIELTPRNHYGAEGGS